MEEFDSSGGWRKPNRSVARHSGIFGGFAASCSIPLLVIPQALDVYEESGLDYGEIFGSLCDGGFAPCYEELVAEKERAEADLRRPEEMASKETERSQKMTEVSEFSPGDANRNCGSSSKDQTSSIGNHLIDSFTQLNMPDHKTSQGTRNDTINESASMAQLHAASRFTSDVDLRPTSHNTRRENSPNIATSEVGLYLGLNGGLSNQKRHTFSDSSSARRKSFGNAFKTEQKHIASKCPNSEDGPVNLRHLLYSSRDYSTSREDRNYPAFTNLNVSGASLCTQPLQVPPPSTPSPKIVRSLETRRMSIHANSKTDLDRVSLCETILNHQQHSGQDAPKRCTPQMPPRNMSFFCDVEVDASSGATLSAAAMKEAMEQTHARLKSAKARERKREKFRRYRKLRQNDSPRCKEGKVDKAAQDVKIFSEVVTQRTFIKDDKNMKEIYLEERRKASGAAKVALEHEDRERDVVLVEQDQQLVQPDECNSSKASYKSNDRNVEWETRQQFYESVYNERKFEVVMELSDPRFVEEVSKASTKFKKEKHTTESKIDYLSNEFESKENLLEVNEIRGSEKYTMTSKAVDTACLEEKREVPITILEFSVGEENVSKLKEIFDSHRMNDDRKPGEVREARVSEEGVHKPNIAEDTPACGETENELKPSVDDCQFEVACQNEGKERSLKAPKEACECEESKELTHNCEHKLKIADKEGMHEKNDETNVPRESCMCDGREEVEVAPELTSWEIYVMSQEEISLEFYKENEIKLQGTCLVSEQDECRKLNRIEVAYVVVETDLDAKNSEAKKMEENLKELKLAKGTIGSRDNEKRQAEKVGDYDEKNTREAQLGMKEDIKEKMVPQEPCELEKNKLMTESIRARGQKENKNIREVHVNMDVKEKYNLFNVAQEVSPMVVNRKVEDDREAKLLKMKGEMSSSSRMTIPAMAEHTDPESPKTEKKNKRQMERELEEYRKLDEREREREKDRNAVERVTHDTQKRALYEARERAERISVERIIAEARQRVLAEVRRKAEKTSVEAFQKYLAEKASREARLRMEHATVRRATTETWERSVKIALAEKAAAGAREYAWKLNAAILRDKLRRDSETEEYLRGINKVDRGTWVKPSSFGTHDEKSKNVGSSSCGLRHSDSYNHGECKSSMRCKARPERNQWTMEHDAKALAEKNMRDILAQKEQADINRLAEILDANVRTWSTGKEGNLRALLSTLQYILGPESSWQPILLTDVVTAAAIKKAYRKATLCVHPDKLQQRGASIQQKYICEKVFDLLKDAWNRFNSEVR